jgi:hypothetical protein
MKNCKTILCTILFIAVFLFPQQLKAQDSLNVSKIGQYNYGYSTVDKVSVQNDLAFLLSDDKFKILDISDPTSPALISEHEYNDHTLYMKTSDEYAMVAGNFQIHIFDILDSENIEEIGTIETGNYPIRDFDSVGNILVVQSDMRFMVYNISDPSSPVLLSNIQTTDWTYGVNLFSGYAYLNQGTDGLRVIDLSDPTLPQSVRLVADAGNVKEMVFVDDYAFILDNAWNNDIKVFDVSNPSNPSFTLSFRFPQGNEFETYIPYSMTIQYNKAFVIVEHAMEESNSEYEMRELDISDPENIFEVDCNYSGGHFSTELPHIDSDDNFIYIASERRGLQIFECIGPSQYDFASSYDLNIKLETIVLNGNFLYGLDRWNENLIIYNISDPFSVVEIGSCSVDIEYGILTVYDNFVVVSKTGFDDIHKVVDVSDPANPFIVGITSLGYCDQHMLVKDDLLIKDTGSSHRIYNISDLFSPSLVASFDDYEHTMDKKINNNYLYLLSEIDDEDDGEFLKIIDLSNPSSPQEIGSLLFGIGIGCRNLDITDNYAYVTSLNNIIIVDISDPSSPVEAGRFPLSDNRACKIDGNYMFVQHAVANEEYRYISVLDISDPTSPVREGYYSQYFSSNWLTAIEAKDGYLYYPYFGELIVLDCTNITVSVDEENNDLIPREFAITSAYPNPFNPTLNVSVALPEESNLKVMIYNVMGQNVAALTDRQHIAGTHNFTFDGSDLSSGVYFVHASVAGKLNRVKKVVLMK